MLTLRFLAVVLLALRALSAQSTLALSSATASGGSASLSLILTSTGSSPAALQWTTQYTPSDIQSVTAVAGAAAIAAGKTITCAGSGSGYKCILAGLNANTIPNGVVAVLTVTLAPSAASTVSLGVAETIAASPDGNALSLTGAGGTVTSVVVPTISGLSCTPSSLGSNASGTCTATVSGATGGVVALSSNNTLLTVPTSVSVPAGSATATFPVTTGIIGSDQGASITATFNGSSRTATLGLTAPPKLTSLSCSPATLGSAGSTSCAVTLSNTSGGTVSLSSNSGALTLPATVIVPAGSNTASFSAAAGSISSEQNANVTAGLNGSSQTASVALTTALVVSSLSCSGTTLTANSSTTCTVLLSKSSGGTVSLSSSNPAATVPPSVAVPSGSASAMFTVTVGALSGDQPVSISASLSGVSRTATLSLVGPLIVSSLVCNPSSVAPSQTSTCTIIMSKTGGGTVSLSSSSGSVTLPSTITVAPDTTTASFPAVVAANATDQVVALSASFNGSSRSASLLVSGIVTISSLTCGAVSGVDSSGTATCVVTLSKAGGGNVTISSNHPSVMAPAVLPVAPHATNVTFVVAVSGVTGEQSATITATLNGSSKATTLALSIPITITSLTCSPPTVSAGGATTCTVTLSRTGGGTVAVASSSVLLSIPASVSIGSGATSATFSANAGGVIAADQIATVTASLNGSSRSATVSLTNAVIITSLTCSTMSLQTGDHADCTVTLSKTGAASVTLSISSALLSAPTSVNVASTASTASFTVSAGTINADSKATLTASFNSGSSLSIVIDLVTPTRVTSLSCTPTVLGPDGSGLCTVTLSTTAGGIVSITSDNTSLSVPGNLTVPAGAASRSFAVKAGAITANQTATVRAALGASWQAAAFILTTAAGVQSISCSPSTLISGSASTCTVTLPHTQGGTVTLSSSNPVVGVPGILVVSPSSSSASFTVTAGGLVDPNLTVIVTASLNGIGASAGLSVLASNFISALTCSPDESAAGTLLCAVDLMAAAPAGGTAVEVQTTGSRLTPPSNVMVPEGQQSASFIIRVAPSDLDEQPLITASIPGAIRTTSLPILGIRPTIVRFHSATAKAGNWIDAEIELNRPNVPEIARLSLTSNVPELRLPRTITTRPRQTRVAFKLYVEPTVKQQSAEIAIQFGQTVLKTALPIEQGSAPILSVPANVATRYDEPVSFAVSAADPDGLPIVIATESLPPGASFDPASGLFSWTPGSNQQGKYDLVFTATNTAQAASTGHVIIYVDAGSPIATRLRNAATSTGPACSPGALATVEGRWLGSDRNGVSDPSGSATSLNGVAVRVDDKYVPVVLATWDKVTFLCPATDPEKSLSVVVETAAGTTEPLTGSIAAAAPGLFAIGDSDAGQALAYLSGTALLATSRDYRGLGQPAMPGDAITMRATGFTEGSLAIVTIGGQAARIESVQWIPGVAGVVEITATVPPGTPTDDHVPVALTLPAVGTDSATADRVRSNTVTIAIEPAKD